MVRDELHPCANTNASGAALLIEAARALAATPAEVRATWKRSLVVMGSDARFPLCRGVDVYAEEPPVPLEDLAAVVNVESVGRSLGDLMPFSTIVMGAEHSEVLHAAVARTTTAQARILQIGADFHFDVADYKAFLEREIPCLYVTGGPTFDWKLPTDTPDKIRWDALGVRTEWTSALLAALLSGERPGWREAQATMDEIRDLRVIAQAVVEASKAKSVPPMAERVVTSFKANVEATLKAGKVTLERRKQLRAAVKVFIQLLPALRSELDGR